MNDHDPDRGKKNMFEILQWTLGRADSQNLLVVLSGDESAMAIDVDPPFQPLWNWLCRVLPKVRRRHDHADR